MGVHIKGMEMPKDEAVALYIYPDGRVKLWRPQAAVIHEYEAIPVPEHGRLIDADAFKKRMIQGVLDAREDAATEEIWLKILDAVNNLCLDVDEQPTIIPADKEV